jgi:ElaB/YqjD/DUF883 family membrane-anchored ribosome-binding protein
MITRKGEPVAERVSNAADAVKHAWGEARDRGSDVVDAAREKVDHARAKVGDAQDALADQLESAAKALRRRNSEWPITRMTRDRPVSAIMVAFAVGALAGAVAGIMVAASEED